MKIYTCTYDLAMPSANKFWVAPNSDFKIGIKVELRGQAYAGNFTLKQNGQTVTADEDKTAGFTTYTIKSGGPGSVIYTVDVPDAQQKFTLVQVVTDSTVFDVGSSGGGDVPADVATQSWVNAQISDFVDEDELTAYYTKSETSSAAEIGTALEGKQPAGNYLTAETEPAFAAMSADIVVDGDLTAYYTKSETSSAAELADAFASAGGGGVTPEDAINNNINIPQTVCLKIDGSISAYNLTTFQDLTSTIGTENTKIVVGTQISSLNGSPMYNGQLKEYILPNTIKFIDKYAFSINYNPSPVKYVRIPDSVVSCSSVAFWNTDVPIVDFGNTRTTVPKTEYNYAIAARPIVQFYVPDALYDTWISSNIWSVKASQIHRHSELEAPYLYSSKVTGGAQTGTTGTPATIQSIKSVYETDWETLSAIADANTFYVVLPDPA